MKTIQFRRAVAWFLMLALSIGSITQAMALTLATTPLAASTTSVVRPNLMYVLDDSGSMAWDYTPDYINDATVTDPTNAGLAPPGSSGDTGSVTIVGGVITAITAVGGNVYGNGTPTAVIMGAGTGAAAAVTMNTTTNKIASVTVTNGGSGYVAGSTYVTFVGGLSSSAWGMCWGTTGSSNQGGAPKDTTASPTCTTRSQMPYSTAAINYQYYDPAIRYLPPLKADGTSYAAASTSAPVSDGFAGGSGTSNLLTTGWQHEIWCSVASPSPTPTKDNIATHAQCKENTDTTGDNLYPNVTYTFRKTYNGPAYYNTMEASEYCSSTTYTNCVTRAQALAAVPAFQIGGVTYNVPSKYRWCSYYNPYSKTFSTNCQNRRDLDHYVPNYLGGWLTTGATGVHATAVLKIGETETPSSPGTTAGQQITGLTIGGVDVVGGTTFTSATTGDQNTVATNVCNAIKANTESTGFTCSTTNNRVTIEAAAVGTADNTKSVLVSGPNVAGANSIGAIHVSPAVAGGGATAGLQMSSILINGNQLLTSTVTADGTQNNTAKMICDAINTNSGSGYTARANTIANLTSGSPSAWGTCTANADGYVEIKRNAEDAVDNGQAIVTAGPAAGAVSSGSILITATSGTTSITDVTLDTDGAAGPLAAVSILTGGTLNIADGTDTTAIGTALAAKIGGSGCSATASSGTVTVTGCTCTAASCPIAVTSPSTASTGTMSVTSTTHSYGADLGGIQVNGVNIASAISSSTLTNGQSVSANATSVKNAITSNGFSAAVPVCSGSGDAMSCNIVVTAPVGTTYNGKSFTFLAGTASGGAATSPTWNFRIDHATADNALLEHIRCDASNSNSTKIYALSTDASTGTATVDTLQRTTNLANDLNAAGTNGYAYSCVRQSGTIDNYICNVTGPSGASKCTADLGYASDKDATISLDTYSKTSAGGTVCGAATWEFQITNTDDWDSVSNIKCNTTETITETAYTGNGDSDDRRDWLKWYFENKDGNGYSYSCNSNHSSNTLTCTVTGPTTPAACTTLAFTKSGSIDLAYNNNFSQSCVTDSSATWRFTINSATADSKYINSIKCSGTDTITVGTVSTGTSSSSEVTRINNLAASIEANDANGYTITCGRANSTDVFADCTITGPAGVNACLGADNDDSHNCAAGSMSFKYNGNDDNSGIAFSGTGFNSNDTSGTWRSCLPATGNGSAGGTSVDNFAPYLFTVSTFSGGTPTQVTTTTPVTSTTVGPIGVTTDAMSNQGAPAVTAIPTNASGAGLNVLAMAGGTAPDTSANNWNGVGIFKRVDVVSTNNSYSRESGRTDCVGATCTYNEELQNFANWYSYYRTRMLMMKSATTLAFSQLDGNYRVGYDNICNATGTSVLRGAASFTGTARTNWWSTMTSETPSCATPLRAETAKIGRYFAGKVGTDPMEYSCQQNYMILVTDGYWNETDSSSIKGVDNADIGNRDNSLTTTARPYFDGQMSSTTCPSVGSNRGSTASSCRTLADIAWYFYSTDLRTVAFGNNTNGTTDVSTNNVLTTSDDKNQAQHMNFFAMGLGIDGRLAYQSDYLTASTGDYAAIVAGSKNWPAVANLDPTGVDDLWHATASGHGKYFSARNVPNVVSGLREALNKIGARVGSAAAAATSNLEPVAGDNYAYVASYATVDWTGDLQSRSIDVSTGDVSSSTDCSGTGTSTTISGSSGATSITVDSASGLVVGSTVSGTGIASGAVITAISGTTLTLSVANTAAVSGTGAFKYGCQWSAQTKLDNLSWSARKIYVAPSSGTSGAALRAFTYAGLSGAEQAYFNPSSLSQYAALSVSNASDITASNLVDFLRGNRGLEQDGDISHAQIWRRRPHVLGDIVNTQPVFMKTPSASYADAGYSDFKSTGTASTRKSVVFVSAQDGMLHTINAHTAPVTVGGSTVAPGEEMWAFIPTQVMSSMNVLADVNYAHRYFIDGQITIADVDFGSGNWHTILVGGQGAGGTSYYALDVTDPLNPTYLWEFTHTDLGYSFSNSTVSKLPNGEWAVLFSSGYNNDASGSNGDGYLFALNPETGAVKTGFPIATGATTVPSNLGKIAVWADAPSTDNTALYVYAGDLYGDLWRFDLDHTASGHTNTQVFKLAHLESGGVAQPITTKPELSQLESGTRLVFVGTGKYLETSDLTSTAVQGFYAVKDTLGVANKGGASQETWNPSADTTTIDVSGTPTVVPMFLTRKLISEDENNAAITATVNGVLTNVRKVCPGASSTVTGAGACANTDPTAMDWDIYGGWYVGFPDSGERMNVDPKLVRGTLVFATNIPAADSCTVGGSSWANFLDYSTGLPVDGETTVSIKISDSLVVGITVVKLQSGDYKAIATKSSYQQETLAVPIAASPGGGGGGSSSIFGGKRGLWREFEAY
ncbi:MAG: PilC/PilY family type IV pilus protein [Sulfuritalea sp.]|jgi:type IV pilus assembly protein PilY1|nr:PilC/PilY family type IV pilus protein [Sulfuritalea sp.]